MFTTHPNHPPGSRLAVQADGDKLLVTLDTLPALRLRLGERAGTTRDAMIDSLDTGDAAVLQLALLGALDTLFGADPTLAALRLSFADHPQALPPLLHQGLAFAEEGRRARFTRDAFIQQPALWLEGWRSASQPLSYRISNGKRHPLRPPKPAGVVYRRHIPWLGQELTLRTLDADTDLERFHLWMNNPRVAKFWEEDGDLDKHRTFIANALADPHCHPLVASLDDEPFAYFEAYWAKEDRIAPFYAAGDYDRGVHMLVGEEWARGSRYVAAWLPSLLHYLFLDDPRTQLLVCEPRADNARMIAYLQRYGFAYLRQFDFPHKRAALLALEREVFAAGAWLNAPALDAATK